jgi:hypothetical protein
MSLINNINKESKIVGRNKHILINDAGIGSNRLVMSNNYLNYFNITKQSNKWFIINCEIIK